MDLKQIDFGKVIMRILELIIIKPLTLPLKVYFNALTALSNSNAADSEESNLSADFPLYIWLISIFDAIIVIIYPLGILAALIAGFNSSLGIFIGILVAIYFTPLLYGLIREFAQISLKALLYLKIISKK